MDNDAEVKIHGRETDIFDFDKYKVTLLCTYATYHASEKSQEYMNLQPEI